MAKAGKNIRTRFAPSPTGFLHVGGARTALFNWLLAKKTGGDFILRIEDTDQARNTPEARQAILDGMSWLGLTWDEGPFYQSERLDIYQQYVQQLIDAGRAYRCYMTSEDLQAKRDEARKQNRDFRYQRQWAEISDTLRRQYESENRPCVIRFRMPDTAITFTDDILGEIVKPAADMDDFVIVKSDGFPTYHFACVVDDSEMAVTHVIRGKEHLENTPRHVALQQALCFSTPAYAHLPILLNPDGSKISKRQLDNPDLWARGFPRVKINDYRAMGILPEALINFLALLGWSPGDDREIMPLADLIAAFSLDRVGKGDCQFNPEKLEWMNGQYIMQLDEETLLEHLREFPLETKADDETVRQLIRLYRERIKTLAEFGEKTRFFFSSDFEYDPKAVKKILLKNEGAGLKMLAESRQGLAFSQDFSVTELDKNLRGLCETHGVGFAKVAQPLRVAICGSTVSPPIFETLALLGKDETLIRIDRTLEQFSAA